MNTLADDELIAAVEARTLPLGQFHHAQHVHLAWAYLQRLPLLEALAKFRATLIAYVSAHGKSHAYHETITIACMLLVHERIAVAPRAESWPAFAERNADLLTWKGGPFFDYYGPEIVDDRLARLCFVAPRPRAA